MDASAIATLALTMLTILAGMPAQAGIARIVEQHDDANTALPHSESLTSIARLPSDLRKLVLEASRHPELLESLSPLNESTHRELGELTQGLPDRHRQQVWLLLGHPELVAAMASEATQPALFFEQITSHPESIAKAGRTLLLEDPELVRNIFALQSRASSHYDRLLSRHARATQITFRRLLAEPIALDMVLNEQSLLRSLGALYRHDRVATERALDRLAEASIAEHSVMLPGW